MKAQARHGAIALTVLAGLLGGCGVDVPGIPDGRSALVVAVVDTAGMYPGGVPGEPWPVDSAEVSVESRTHMYAARAMTGPDGNATFDRLDVGIYSVFARRETKIGSANKVFTGSFKVELDGDVTVIDTVNVKLVATSKLMINEIFYTGSCASMFYFYDQFVELYNSSDETMYLDGMLLMRANTVKDPLMDVVDYVKGLYAFQFPGVPGTGREYPIQAGHYLVIASDATNHSAFCPTSPDLRTADWEAFNALGNDFDNPAVPNLNNIIPGRTIDFLISLGHNGVFLTSGEEYTIDTENRVRVPVGLVVDGVEYNANPQYSKEMTVRVDAGYAGVGMTNYSARSVERRVPGLDTNDSTFDFTIISPVTPGYFHAP